MEISELEAAQNAGGRERQAVGGGFDARQAYPAGGRQKKDLTAGQARTMVDQLRDGYGLTIQRRFELLVLRRSTYYYRSRARDKWAFGMRIKELAMSRIRFGYLRLTVLLRRRGPGS
jgi:hypothetical protein